MVVTNNYTYCYDLVWLSREGDAPAETWTDTYVDLQITRWGFKQGPTEWFEGCGRRKKTVAVEYPLLYTEAET